MRSVFKLLAPALILTMLFSLSQISIATAFLSPSKPSTSQLDRSFIVAAASSDRAVVVPLLDDDFSWTDIDGKSLSRNQIMDSVPSPVLGNESGVEMKEDSYGAVKTVIVNRGKIYVFRAWVQRPEGWRLLVYHEVKQLDQPSNSAGTGVLDCENPCKVVPFQPTNESEKAIIASWQALETGVTTHNSAAWAPHIADDFLQISSNSDHPISKEGRMAVLDKQKISGVGSAPAPLVSAPHVRFWRCRYHDLLAPAVYRQSGSRKQALDQARG